MTTTDQITIEFTLTVAEWQSLKWLLDTAPGDLGPDGEDYDGRELGNARCTIQNAIIEKIPRT